MSKIKVLFVGMSDNLGGIEIFGRDLILNSDLNEIDYTLLLKEGVSLPFQDDLVSKGVKILRFHSRKTNYLKFLKDLKAVFQNNKFDIVHINIMDYSFFEVIKYAHKNNCKIILHSHNGGYIDGRWKNKVLNKIGKTIVKKYEVERVACSEDAGKYLFDGMPFKVFLNGIDFEKFEFSQKNRNEIREELNIDKKTYLIGNIGAFWAPKNHVFLVRVFAKVKAKNNNVKLLLVGDGEELGKIKSLVTDMRLEDDVIFLQKRIDIERIYSALDLYVAPSISEGMSLALCEAQVNNLKCIVSNGVGKTSDISGTVKFLDLSSSEKWVEVILDNTVDMKREKVYIDSKFDVKNTVHEICEYYAERSIADGC